jgi:hypothetical protein
VFAICGSFEETETESGERLAMSPEILAFGRIAKKNSCNLVRFLLTTGLKRRENASHLALQRLSNLLSALKSVTLENQW